MTRAEGLLDTNIVVLVDRLEAHDLPRAGWVSTVTLAELRAGPLLASSEEERDVRVRHSQFAEAHFEAIPFDASAVEAFATVAAGMRRQGRKVAARTYDALIAATAVSRRLPLYTCNAEDFAGVPGLEVVAVPHPGA